MTESSEGRCVLVAVVTGPLGDIIRDWRIRHDPQQARRLPPHATLCYWVSPEEDAAALERQVRHAFDRPVRVRLGNVREFTNRDGTFFVDVLETGALDEARFRLFDGAHLQLAGPSDFTWHVTCVRYPDDANRERLRLAARDLDDAIAAVPEWTIDSVAWLQLRDGVYQSIQTWDLAKHGAIQP